MNLTKAVFLAAQAHMTQRDRGGHSYILHPMRIAMRLRTNDEELMAIAMLHDAKEDGGVTDQQLRDEGFSDRVINALNLLTHDKSVSYETYIENMAGCLDALRIKREDLKDNSDITRLKGVRQKDIDRTVKYQKAFQRVEELIALIEKGGDDPQFPANLLLSERFHD